jgi:hypothetical protein
MTNTWWHISPIPLKTGEPQRQVKINIVTWHPKGRIVEPEDMAVARQRLNKHMSIAMDM